MKKFIIIILLISVAINAVFAQNERKRALTINAGVSIPFSDFAIEKFESYAGFAGTGMNVGIDYLSSKREILGFSASAGYSILNFKSEAYRSEYDRVFNQYGENKVTAGNYHVIRTVAGMTLKTPEFHHIELLFLVQAGFSMSIHPEIIVNNSRIGVINSITQDYALALTSNIGIKMNYNISDKYGLNVNYGLNYLKPDFQDRDGDYGHSFMMPVRFQNINLGFIIKL